MGPGDLELRAGAGDPMRGLKPSPEAVFAFTTVGAGWGIYNSQVSTVWGFATLGAAAVAAFLAGRHAR
jgi:hypothetical protein